MTVALFWTRIHAQMIFAGHCVYRRSPLIGILHLPTTSNAAMRIKCVILFPSIISLLEGYGHSQKQQGLQWSLRKRELLKHSLSFLNNSAQTFRGNNASYYSSRPLRFQPRAEHLNQSVSSLPPLPAPCIQACLSGKILATQRDGMNGTYNYPRNQCPET